VSFDDLLKDHDCDLALVLGQSPKQRVSPDQHIPGIEVFWRAVLRTDAFGLQQLGLNCGNNLLGDLVLERKNVGQIAVVVVSPQVLAGRAVDQLGGDAHAAAVLADAPLKDVTHPEFAPDLAYVDRLAFIDERRIARDHKKPAQLG
jgi:hypothetical protein